MAWCFSTRASVATVLTTHPCVSRCLRVNSMVSHNMILPLLLTGYLGWWYLDTCVHMLISHILSGLEPSQWEMALLCNAISHWLGANLESALFSVFQCLLCVVVYNSWLLVFTEKNRFKHDDFIPWFVIVSYSVKVATMICLGSFTFKMITVLA